MTPRSLAILALTVLLVSCGASIQSSESYYRPTVMQTFPPKTKDAHIPILASIPKEKCGAIGMMEFGTTKGADYINQCLVHNARKNGADAVVILAQNSSASQVPFTLPGYTTYQPQTTYSTFSGSAYGSGGYANATGQGTSTTYAPVYQPGMSGVRTVVSTYIKAAFVKFYPR